MRRIHDKLLIIFMILSLLPMSAIAAFSYYKSSNTLLDKLNHSSLIELEQIVKNIDKKVDNINKYMDVIFANEKVHEIMTNVDFVHATGNAYMAYYELTPMIFSLFYQDTDVKSTFLFLNSGGHFNYKGYIDSSFKIDESKWYDQIVNAEGRIIWFGNVENFDKLNSDKQAFLVGRVIKDTAFKKSLKPIGTAIFLLDKGFFSDIYKNVKFDSEDRIIIADSEGRLLSNDNKNQFKNLPEYSFGKKVVEGENGVFKDKFEGHDVIVTYYTSVKTGLKAVRITPYLYYMREIRSIGWLTLVLFILCLVIVYTASFIIARDISNPISRLVIAMDKVGNKNFDVSVSVNSNDEIGFISSGFNDMVINLKNLFEKTVEEEKQNRKAQVRALQYQINPHFLYNTLGSIQLIATMQNATQVAEMIRTLSRLLRNTLNKVDTMITVDEEMNNLKDYLSIQQIRYKNRINVSFDISEL